MVLDELHEAVEGKSGSSRRKAVDELVLRDGLEKVHHGLGNGDLLCHLPSDLKHFKKITTGYAVIMGRRTYESLPKGALPNRTNIVITSGAPENYPGCTVVRSVEEALSRCSNQEKVFIIGGGKLYRSALHLATQLYLTRIHHTFDDADTFFPEIPFTEWKLVEKESHETDDKHPYAYTFLNYNKK